MQQINLDLEFQTIPPVAQRDRHVLIVIKNAQGNYILGSKKHYPTGIARLIGGGLEGTEEAQLGAVRELFEETGIKIEPNQLVPLAQINAHLKTSSTPSVAFVTYLFFFNLGTQEIMPSDDIDAVVELTPDQMQQLLEIFNHLSPEINPQKNFAWSDWGALYGAIHTIAYDLTKSL